MTKVKSARLADRIRRDVPHLPAAEVPVLADLVERLICAYEPEQIYLFGSKARGDWGPNSDFDLLVVVPDTAPPERQESSLAYQVLRGTGVAADSRLHVIASLPATVAREGRLLHVA